MRCLFIAVGFLLLVGALVTRLTAPDMQGDVPVIYWATDANPARLEQIRLYHEWLVDNGYTTPDGRPFVELRLDTVGGGEQKLIIQGVSGIAADVFDRGVPGLEAFGILADLTDDAQAMGFSLDHTYPPLRDMLTVDGRQYGFPCNVALMAFWVNVDTFAKLGLEPPPREWDLDTFERLGKAFVARANPDGQRQTVFFTNSLTGWFGSHLILVGIRSQGLSIFNETLTGCTLDDPRYADMLARIYTWTYVDKLVPSAAEAQSMAAESGYGGSNLAMLISGNYGMTTIGRWCLIRLRQLEQPPRLSVSYYPYVDFPNAVCITRAAGVYAGSAHQDKAMTFLAFLASERYNRHIAEQADSMPPVSTMTETEDFLRPPAYPNEWGTHGTVAQAMQTIAIAEVASPFVESSTVVRTMNQAQDLVMANQATAVQAAAQAAARVNDEIAQTVRDNIRLRERFREATARQQQIDARRAAGEPVPASWITNPVLRRYYAHRGWLESEETP